MKRPAVNMKFFWYKTTKILKSNDYNSIIICVVGLFAISYLYIYLRTTELGSFFFDFIFSFRFIEVKQVSISHSFIEPQIQIDGFQNSTVKFLNIGKVLFWIIVNIMIVRFLFKKPLI
jgi:hypothetical protein